ncbi:MAG: nucleotide exchange factor GrpE [Cyanobacteria bacterium J06641_5]
MSDRDIPNNPNPADRDAIADAEELPTAAAAANLEAETEEAKVSGEPEMAGEPAAAVPLSAAEQAEAISLLQQEIGRLREQLDLKQKQQENFQAQAIRIAADFENFRKRTQREKEEAATQIKGDTIVELLQVIDNFERARQQLKPATDGELAIHKSYQGVYKQLVDALKRLGVSKMRPVETEFDPNYHEAMMREPTERYPEGTVTEELIAGYLLGERVLRHAMVKVAAPPEPVVTSEDVETET